MLMEIINSNEKKFSKIEYERRKLWQWNDHTAKKNLLCGTVQAKRSDAPWEPHSKTESLAVLLAEATVQFFFIFVWNNSLAFFTVIANSFIQKK